MIMQTKKSLYLYPFTKATLRQGGNTYIPDLITNLGQHFTVVNKQTNLGLLDVILKMPKCDVLYFNWIEDVADKKFGAMQVLLLATILVFSTMSGKMIVWFLHNNLSHKKKNQWLKKRVVGLMKRYADLVLSHSNEAYIEGLKQDIQVFDHPVGLYQPVTPKESYLYDLLIWGTVSPYKGVAEFLSYNKSTTVLHKYKILVAGKFSSEAYYEEMKKLATNNVIIENKILSEDDITRLFSESRYILFTYNATSVLSSAALCKTLVSGKTIIGPNVGAFKELGKKGLIYNYNSFEELASVLENVETKKTDPGSQHK